MACSHCDYLVFPVALVLPPLFALTFTLVAVFLAGLLALAAAATLAPLVDFAAAFFAVADLLDDFALGVLPKACSQPLAYFSFEPTRVIVIVSSLQCELVSHQRRLLLT